MNNICEQAMDPLTTKTSLFDKRRSAWLEIKEQVVSLTLKGLGIKADDPILGQRDDVISFNNIEDAFLSEKSIVMVLRENNNLIGYTLAMPIDCMDPTRASEGKETAYMYYTVMDKPYRGKKLVSRLTDPLLMELNRRGYHYVERDVKIKDGYADNVEKNSEGSIVSVYDADKFNLGPQRFLRIDIQENLKNKGLI
jgi:hypothetical protein